MVLFSPPSPSPTFQFEGIWSSPPHLLSFNSSWRGLHGSLETRVLGGQVCTERLPEGCGTLGQFFGDVSFLMCCWDPLVCCSVSRCVLRVSAAGGVPGSL